MYDEDLLTQAQKLIYALNREKWQQKQAAQPPMDPAMMGGAPPMDPAMMGGGGMPPMDPAMMGGAPPMDPAMMGGGGMPPMDPAMMGGGAAPPMDTAPMGGTAPADPAADPAAAEAPKQKMKPEQWMEKLDTRLYNLQVQMAAVMKHLDINVPPESLILPNSKPDVDNPNPTLPDVGAAPEPPMDATGGLGLPPEPAPEVKAGSWQSTKSLLKDFQKMGMHRIPASETPESRKQSISIPEDYVELARALGYRS